MAMNLKSKWRHCSEVAPNTARAVQVSLGGHVCNLSSAANCQWYAPSIKTLATVTFDPIITSLTSPRQTVPRLFAWHCQKVQPLMKRWTIPKLVAFTILPATRNAKKSYKHFYSKPPPIANCYFYFPFVAQAFSEAHTVCERGKIRSKKKVAHVLVSLILLCAKGALPN